MKKQFLSSRKLALGIGCYSIAVAVLELLSPKTVNQTVGLNDDTKHRNLVRIRGLRELISGVGIVAAQKPAAFLWSRVAGDLLDFVLVGKSLTSSHNQRQKLMIATAVFSGVALIDVLGSLSQHKSGSHKLRLKRSIKVNGTPRELYSLWRHPETLSTIMEQFAEFEYIDEQSSHWKIPGEIGPALEWEAQIVEAREGEYLRWESLPGTTLPTKGWVSFRSVGKQSGKTEVSLCMDFEPPAGVLGEAALTLVQGIPNGLVQIMLTRFKQLAEDQKAINLTGNHKPSTIKVGTRPGDGAGAF